MSAAPTASVEKIEELSNHLVSCRYNLELPTFRSLNVVSFSVCMQRWIDYKDGTYPSLVLAQFMDMHPLLPHWTTRELIRLWLWSNSCTLASLEKSLPGNLSAARRFLSSPAPRPSLVGC